MSKKLQDPRAGIRPLRIDGLDTRHRSLRLTRPDVLESLRRSIARHGVLQPITVNLVDAERPVLIDGFKRVEVLREQRATEVRARVLSVSAEQAQAAILTYNRPHRGLTQLEEGWVVHALHRDHGLAQTAIAELVGRHKSWVCRRLALVERLAKAVQDDMRLGLLSVTMARQLVRLPRGNQEAMAHAASRHELATRDLKRVVDVWLSSDEVGRRQVLEDPVRVLEPPSTRPHRAPLRPSEQPTGVFAALKAFGRQAREFVAIVGGASLSGETEPVERTRWFVGDVRDALHAADGVLDALDHELAPTVDS